MEFAENLALDHKFQKDLGMQLQEAPSEGGFHYVNAKKTNVIADGDEDSIDDWEKYMSAPDRNKDNDSRFAVGYTRVQLESNAHFSGIPVNTNMSSVHVPTNVFDGGQERHLCVTLLSHSPKFHLLSQIPRWSTRSSGRAGWTACSWTTTTATRRSLGSTLAALRASCASIRP